MSAHLDQTVTTLSACVTLTPDPSQLAPAEYYTEHDRDLVWQNNTYTSADIEISTIQTSLDFRSDNCTIAFGILTQEEGDQLAARYLNAEIDIFLLNHQDTSDTMGRVDLFFGYVDSVDIKRDKEKWGITLNIRSELARLASKNMERYSRTCRTAFGSTTCGVPVAVTGVDKFEVFPYTARRGDQRYTFPSVFTSIPLNTWQQISGSWTIALPNISYAASNVVTGVLRNTITYTPTKEIWAVTLTASNTSVGFSVTVRQLDSSGNILAVQTSDDMDLGNSHAVTGVWRSGVVSIEIEVNARAGQLTSFSDISFKEFNLIDIDKTRHKLARIPGRDLSEEIPLINPYFVIDGDIGNTLDITKLTGWEGLISVNYYVSGGTLYLTGGYIEQIADFPSVACSLIPSGCYHIAYEVNHTLSGSSSLDVTVDILDPLGNITQSATFTNTTSTMFQVTTTDPSEIKIKVEETSGVSSVAIDSIRVFFINAYLSSSADSSEITLNSASDRGTLGDIWYQETLPVWYETQVTAVSSNKEFTVQLTGLPTETSYSSVLWVTGQNAGLSHPITGWTEAQGTVSLPNYTPKPILVGDKITMQVFCRKRIQDCAEFNNAINFVGEPFLPTAEDISNLIR